MRAVQITELSGPEGLRAGEVPEPTPEDAFTGGPGVVIDVEAAGVAFPEALQSRGRYQLQPPPPFVPGAEVAGRVRSAPPGSRFSPGQQVVAYCVLGGFAEVAVAPEHLTFALPRALSVAQGAGLVMNYHTAWFSLVLRGRLTAGETVLVHGAAGGVGTATLQIARGLGARTIAVVSSPHKAEIARRAGADEALFADGPWKDEARELSGGGVDVVIDPVGGERFTDSLRALAEGGRLVVVGFTAGAIPEVRVNRLLLRNLEVVGAGWGAYAIPKPELCRAAGDELERLAKAGAVAPIVGAELPLERAAEAVALIEGRQATGKVVLRVA